MIPLPLRRCPRCGAPGGLIRCPQCHGPLQTAVARRANGAQQHQDRRDDADDDGQPEREAQPVDENR